MHYKSDCNSLIITVFVLIGGSLAIAVVTSDTVQRGYGYVSKHPRPGSSEKLDMTIAPTSVECHSLKTTDVSNIHGGFFNLI